jgi:hypothetical protein
MGHLSQEMQTCTILKHADYDWIGMNYHPLWLVIVLLSLSLWLKSCYKRCSLGSISLKRFAFASKRVRNELGLFLFYLYFLWYFYESFMSKLALMTSVNIRFALLFLLAFLWSLSSFLLIIKTYKQRKCRF